MTLNPGISDGVDQVMAKISELLTCGTPLFVLIAGGSCSGKTTLALELKKKIPTASVMSMDDYFRDLNDPELPVENGRKSFNSPGSYQLGEIAQHLKTLSQGYSVLAPIYDLEHNQRTLGKKMIQAAEVIIVDGLYAIEAAKNLNLNKLAVFVSATYQTRFNRRLERDKNIVSAEVIERHFRCNIEPLFEKYVLPQLKTADIVIKNV